MAVIHEVDEALRRLLAEALAGDPSPVIKDPAQVVLGLPANAPKTGDVPLVGLFLHDVRENLQMRDESMHVTRDPGGQFAAKFRGLVRLDLAYLVWASAGEDVGLEHRVLSECLVTFYRNQIVPEKYLPDDLRSEGTHPLLISVAQSDHPAHDDAPVLWQSLGTRLRPTISLVATVSFNPFESRQVRLVREALVALGQGVPPSGQDRQMTLAGVRASIAGYVGDGATGAALEGANVSVEGLPKRVSSDERGLFWIADLPAGTYKVRVDKRGYEPIEQETQVPPLGRPDLLEPLLITLVPSDGGAWTREANESPASGLLRETGRIAVATLIGRLRYSDGRPAAYVPVRAGAKTAMTDGEGVYHFTGLATGKEPVTALVPGHGEVTVTPEEGIATLAEPEPAPSGKTQAKPRQTKPS